ncbi:exo-alpha-sialidase, partial [bacterium]
MARLFNIPMSPRILPLLCALAIPLVALAKEKPKPATGITWNSKAAVRITDGTYGRIKRLKNGTLLCCYEARGRSYVRRSTDEGQTWGNAILVRQLAGSSAANPELLQLKSGRIWLFFNGRPRDGIQKFTIDACWSDDNGTTWTARNKPIFEAGTEGKIGCWEPAAVQMSSGEIQLFFANELPFPANDDQEITLMRSRDNGTHWSKPQRVCYRAGHRDGMPVPLILKDSKRLVFSIEDNGLQPGNILQPVIISTVGKNKWTGSVDGNNPRRWSAPAFPKGVYGGAPYIAQLPSGETLLSCQSTEGGRKEPRMVVYIG